MYLQKLEIQGFKSFAHKTSLEFSKGVTCIVGPNGSGKSNIADAARWVLGEQSIKMLRGKKAQDVIFAGSKTKTRLGFAQVDLYLNNEDRSAPIDYSEVIISRRLYRNGESEYLVNKNKVRLHDILILLAKANFGQRSYSVVGQGSVDKVLSATPYERKDFFDEATGVKQYQIKREEAVKKLEYTKDNLHQADLLMQEIEPRLRSLTRQVRRLERREVIEEELGSIRKEYYGHLWQEILIEHKNLEERAQIGETEKRKVEKEVESVQSEIDRLAKSRSRDDIFNELQKEYDEFLEKKNGILQEQASLKGRLEGEQQKVGGYDLVFLERRNEELASEKAKLKNELTGLDGLIREKAVQLEEKTRQQDKIVEEFKRIEEELIQSKEKLASKSIPLPEIREELDAIYELQEKIIYELNKLTDLNDLERIKKKAEDLKNRLNGIKDQLKKSSHQADPDEIIRTQDNLTLFIKKKDNLVNEIYYLRISLQLKQEKQKMLQKSLSKTKEEIIKISAELNQLKNVPSNKQEALEILESANQRLKEQIVEIDKQINGSKTKIADFNNQEQKKKDELIDWQKKSQEKQAELNVVARHLNEVRINLARAETKREDLETEMKEELEEQLMKEIFELTQKTPLSDDWSKAELAEKIHKLKNQNYPDR